MTVKSQNSPFQSYKKTKARRPVSSDSLLESFRDIGGGVADNFKKDLLQGIPQDFFKQLFGVERPRQKASGDINPGESIELRAVLEAEREENKVLRAQLTHERKLREDESTIIAHKSQELKIELHALVQEVGTLTKTTQGLARETQIAVMQAPANPGIYHVVFFEKLREFIRSFRKNIENTSIWLQSQNQRAAKKRGFWGQVAKSGAKRLLSQEDYMQRSAG